MHQYVHSDLLCLCVYIIINVYVYMYVYIYIYYHSLSLYIYICIYIYICVYIYIYVYVYIYIHICDSCDTNMGAPSVSPWNYTSDRNDQWLTCASPSRGLAPAGLTTPKLSKMACCWKIPHVSLRFTPL